MTTNALPHPNPPQAAPPQRTPLRIALVLVIVVAIVGVAWAIGDRQGFDEIGQGGINADLLPNVGEPAPELVTFDTNGQLVSLTELRGQPVWLNFWGSWCAPCRAEFPEIQAAYETLRPQGLVMLGVAVGEDPRVAQEYANLVGGTFPVLADPQFLADFLPEDEFPEWRSMVSSYTINNYPTHIFIDREGTVRSVILSPMSYDDAVAQGNTILDSPMPETTPAG